MTRIIFSVLLALVACGGSPETADASPEPVTPRADAASVCIVPSTGGFGAVCNSDMNKLQSWVWIETTQAGEVARRCNEVACPSGAECFVQSDVSGKDDGGALLTGYCQ